MGGSSTLRVTFLHIDFAFNKSLRFCFNVGSTNAEKTNNDYFGLALMVVIVLKICFQVCKLARLFVLMVTFYQHFAIFPCMCVSHSTSHTYAHTRTRTQTVAYCRAILRTCKLFLHLFDKIVLFTSLSCGCFLS